MDSPQKNYWFKRRRYGWGWIPVTWQGWLVIALYLVVVIGAATVFTDQNQQTYSAETSIFLLVLALATSALLQIGYHKGPTPHWRWGKKLTDNPREDF